MIISVIISSLGNIEMTPCGFLEKAEILKIEESIPELASGKNEKIMENE